MREKVIILMTDDDLELWSIYDESGQAVEHDFESEQEATIYANANGYEVVNLFN